MYRILIADSLGQPGIDLLREAGVEVDLLTDENRPNLNQQIGQYDALIVRSATRVTAELLEHASKLKVVGRAGVGVDNIDIKAATDKGVLVINAPTSNLLSATEHTFALMLALLRRVSAADNAMKQGIWDRKTYVGAELESKTLGIIGFGKIGQGVATRAKAFNMKVIAADPFLNSEVAKQLDVEAVELDELLERCDVLTFHTPLTDQTRGMLSAERIQTMKDGAVVINCGRGGVIDEPALLAAIESGKIGGAGLDVWSKEPPEDFALAKHPKVVATPHLGASTVEAQERVATDTAASVLAALGGSLAVSALNLPFRAAGSHGEPYLALGEQLGRLASTVLGGELQGLSIDLWGVEEGLRAPIAVAALKGALTPALGEAVNFVNAEQRASERGVEVVRSTHMSPSDFSHLVEVTARGPGGDIEVTGTLFAERDARVVRFQGFPLEFRPAGRLLVVRNLDVPGVVGKLGTVIGEAGVNIAAIHLSGQDSGEALAVIQLDGPVPDGLADALTSLEQVRALSVVDMT